MRRSLGRPSSTRSKSGYTFCAKGDGAGHIAITGTVKDEPGMGNSLKFSIDLDQTFLPAILGQLDEIDREYPVLGHP